MVVVAILSPILGAYADFSASKKRLLLIFSVLSWVADSGHIAHPFRSYPHTHSGVIRTLIPG
jgi:MFS-type transporter involved in bile tolerance (Atg22 family)